MAQGAKVVTIILLFLLTLAGTAIGKGSLLYAAGNIRDSNQTNLICSYNSTGVVQECVAVDPNYMDNTAANR